ncbi:MAG TPA: hypothetical protein VM901_02345 [Bdellovibrionota bacterium]|jgi:hypothetical protein|nr:hypothetical protein [Bdellovibrionota bacterium]
MKKRLTVALKWIQSLKVATVSAIRASRDWAEAIPECAADD